MTLVEVRNLKINDEVGGQVIRLLCEYLTEDVS
jgi:hypothetical protein